MSGRRAFATTSVFLLLSVSSGLLATEWHVAPPPLGSNSNPGTTALPFATIQHGIDASSHGDTVIVAQATYVENIKFNGKNIVLRSTDPLNPSVVANTIIDGNQSGSVVTFSGTETQACILSGFTIRNGNAELGGGIVGATYPYSDYSLASIQNNTITDNSAGGGGGLGACDGLIQNNTIMFNSAEEDGGGLGYCDGTIRNNRISANSAYWGGGLNECDGTIQNNTIAGNSASDILGMYPGGGGLARCDGLIQNNTITRNSAIADWNPEGGDGGGLESCSGTIRNCIIWGNIAQGSPQLDYMSSIPTYSCIQGWTGGGEGNIPLDPQFVDANGPDDDPATYEDNNYRLKPDSPCIDAAINEGWMLTATDLDGNPRLLYGGLSLTVDMGAYEYGSWLFRIIRVIMTGTGALQLTWTSRPPDEYVIWSCTDLTSGVWTQEAAVPPAGDYTSWTDPSPSGSRKFYRVERF